MQKKNFLIEAQRLAVELGLPYPNAINIIQEHLKLCFNDGCSTIFHYWPFELGAWFGHLNRDFPFPSVLYHDSAMHAASYLSQDVSQAASLIPHVPWIEDELASSGISGRLIEDIYRQIAVPYAKYKLNRWFRQKYQFDPDTKIAVSGSLPADVFVDECLSDEYNSVKTRLLVGLIIQCMCDSLVCCHKESRNCIEITMMGGADAQLTISPLKVDENDEYELLSEYHYSAIFKMVLQNGVCTIRR